MGFSFAHILIQGANHISSKINWYGIRGKYDLPLRCVLDIKTVGANHISPKINWCGIRGKYDLPLRCVLDIKTVGAN
ncbi:hypothetical protein, partial [Glaesserella parasuis]